MDNQRMFITELETRKSNAALFANSEARDRIYTTLAIGEEGGDIFTTMAIGEEGGC
ncbi:hypothetical protein PAECIP111893_02146 [Paenibacillus plantiphilus]|uniref:Uncharacterized protein n=2 Tax=Paenibacillus TaxID=44249 RepID=A0ABS7D8B0_9BACL|nr:MULTISPECIES: hypothetical protein [Paenibacillus]MBW7476182.1 hypothetical protein [Paenibacillus oenotherae]CAH1204120.1 hypothetical protein PAECIP111893_02146 [Paenibacillus plantiphilus]